MEDNFLPLAEEPQLERRTPIRWLVTAGFFIALAIVLGFAWRTLGFYRDIQNGTLNPALAYGEYNATAAVKNLARLAASKEGDFALESEDDPSLGPRDARLTIVEFADFGCPYSQEASQVVRAVAKQFPDDVRVIYRDLPLVDLHPGADLAARAAECAQEQGAFWEYHDALYAQNESFSEESLVDIASLLGLREDDFVTCLHSDYYEREVADDMADAAAAGVQGTPTFFFNGVKVEGSIPFSTFNDIVHAFLAQ